MYSDKAVLLNDFIPDFLLPFNHACFTNNPGRGEGTNRSKRSFDIAYIFFFFFLLRSCFTSHRVMVISDETRSIFNGNEST